MKLNNLFSGIDISSSALRAHRRAMEVISENIANVNTTRTRQGGPYQKQTPVYSEVRGQEFSGVLSQISTSMRGTTSTHFRGENGGIMGDTRELGGVEVNAIRPGNQEFRLVYEPSHPDADENGYVRFPKINILEEMVELMQTSRSFEASVTAMQAAKRMTIKALEI